MDYYLVESVGSNMGIYLKSSAASLAACGKCLSSVSTRPWFPTANPCILQVINDYISVGVCVNCPNCILICLSKSDSKS